MPEEGLLEDGRRGREKMGKGDGKWSWSV